MIVGEGTSERIAVGKDYMPMQYQPVHTHMHNHVEGGQPHSHVHNHEFDEHRAVRHIDIIHRIAKHGHDHGVSPLVEMEDVSEGGSL